MPSFLVTSSAILACSKTWYFRISISFRWLAAAGALAMLQKLGACSWCKFWIICRRDRLYLCLSYNHSFVEYTTSGWLLSRGDSGFGPRRMKIEKLMLNQLDICAVNGYNLLQYRFRCSLRMRIMQQPLCNKNSFQLEQGSRNIWLN